MLGSRRVSGMRSQRDERMLQICFVQEAANGDVVVTFLMPRLGQPVDNTQYMPFHFRRCGRLSTARGETSAN